MTPVPLHQLGWRDHSAALWWLGLLYRRPQQFQDAAATLSRWRGIRTFLQLSLHALPYSVLCCVLGRLFLFGVLGLASRSAGEDILLFHATRIAVGIAVGIAIGIVFDIVFGIVVGIVEGIAIGIAVDIAIGIAVTRMYYLLVHGPFVWPQVQPRWYTRHPVAWDDCCSVPFPGLDRLLVAYTEYAPAAGLAEIERLITRYPSQRRHALRARITLLAREAGRVTALMALRDIVARLPEGEEAFLRETPRLRTLVQDLVRLQTRLDTIDRPILREPTAQLLHTAIENFRHQVAGFHEPLASEFRAAAVHWLEIAHRQLQVTRAVLLQEPSPQVFRAGDPVDRNQEAFVPRYAVVGELEKQIMLSSGCPGLILYGRRRMGKSTILCNLTGFVPPHVTPTRLSMQSPLAFTSLASLATLLQQTVLTALPQMPHDDTPVEDLPGLFRFLAQCNAYCGAEGKRLLLGIDEYENIDQKIAQGVFSDDLLATVRESIQSHRALTWIFAGSQHITELCAAPWTSYLVGARTIEVPPCTLAETAQLLTEPLKYSSLWAPDALHRPRFTPDFWGEGGIERIHREAGGWPHLIQLIAETTIDLLNDTDSRQVDGTLLERALDTAIVRGDTVLTQLLQGECSRPGEWEYLAGFRTQETQAPPRDEAVYTSLRRRLLVDNANGAWQLRVPLMARWLRKRG